MNVSTGEQRESEDASIASQVRSIHIHGVSHSVFSACESPLSNSSIRKRSVLEAIPRVADSYDL